MIESWYLCIQHDTSGRTWIGLTHAG
jgi:hypothetical protein